MNDDRRSILDLLAAGKINADEAERLLVAIDGKPGAAPENITSASSAMQDTAVPSKANAKYLRVLVEADETTTGLKGGTTTVNIRVPLQLLRAGVRLAGLIPAQAHEQLDKAFSEHGVPITLSQLKPENLEEIIDHFADLTVDVDGKDENKTSVRIFCE